MASILSNGLPLVAVYGLLALGFVVVYRTTGVLNFAQGALMVLGGFVGFALADSGLVGVAVLPALLIIGGLVGAAFYHVAMRPMAGQPVWAPVLVTIGFGFFIVIGLVRLVWSPRVRDFSGQLGFSNVPHDVLGLRMTTLQVVLIASFVVAEVALLAFYRWSRLGIRMRAASQDHHLAAYRSINIDAVFSLAWGIATGLAMYVGFLQATNARLDIGALSVLALKAFPAALAGGMDSIGGVAFGALIIGLAETAIQLHIDARLASVVPFIVLLAVLIVRPWGLFGTPETVDRV